MPAKPKRVRPTLAEGRALQRRAERAEKRAHRLAAEREFAPVWRERPNELRAELRRVVHERDALRLRVGLNGVDAAEADRWYALALALGARCAVLRNEAKWMRTRLSQTNVAWVETRQLLAEAVERASHEPVVEWYRAAKRALRGEE